MGVFGKNRKKDTVVQQDLSKEAEFSNLFMMYLLFEDEPKLPEPELLRTFAEKKLGEVDVICADKKMASFAVKKYVAHFKDADLPPQVMMMKGNDFDPESIGIIERSQFWDVPNGEDIINSCHYQIVLSDFMGGSLLEYKERCEMLMNWLECVIPLFKNCKAVWIPSGGKLFTPDKALNPNLNSDNKYVYYCVNARFFNIEGTDGDMVVDTLGMYAIGLPDVQYHFRGLDPDAVVNHAYNTALYIYANNAPIISGETIDGIENGQMSRNVQWKCQYENALIQPVRTVMDINPAEYAAGTRN